jgi:methionine synthase II (cobalamin-independent)
MPGTDPREAVRVVFGELPELPFLPELPARGAHADLAGRSAALLTDLPVDLQPAGWRLVSGSSRDAGRARDLLSYDLDALEEVALDARPPAVKVQCAGPWTLAALLQLPRGERVLADTGAVDDLAQSLAEGLRRHVADVAARLPGARVVLQLDEPSLPAVLSGGIPTASGFGRVRTPSPARALDVLSTVLAAAPEPVVHCCAPSPPVGLLRRAGAAAVGVDATRVTPRDDEALGELVESGAGLLLGVVPALEGDVPDVTATLAPVQQLWRRLGFAPERLLDTVLLTPTCGLAGASPERARRALAACTSAAHRLTEAPA